MAACGCGLNRSLRHIQLIRCLTFVAALTPMLESTLNFLRNFGSTVNIRLYWRCRCDFYVQLISLVFLGLCLSSLGCVTSQPLPTYEETRNQVLETEAAFAKTMADRDLLAFSTFIADNAIFYAGEDALRGKQEIVSAWSRFFTDPGAPFSWEPATVEVLESGRLAHSVGPVRDPNGSVIGEFASIWRYKNGAWKIIFDRGSAVCDCTTP